MSSKNPRTLNPFTTGRIHSFKCPRWERNREERAALPECNCKFVAACTCCGGVGFCYAARRDDELARAAAEEMAEYEESQRACQEAAEYFDGVLRYDDAAADRDYEQRCARGVEREQQLHDAMRAWR